MVKNTVGETSKIGALNKTLILRVQPSTLDLINKWANDQGVSKSLIARQLLELGKKLYKGEFIVR
jgi:hypothetical protein